MTSDSAVRATPGVERMTVTRRAVEQIKAMIADGTLRPGQRLPTERDLAAGMGLSRSSMREAIRVLTTLGVLEARHGAGVYVTELHPRGLLEPFSVLAEVGRGPTLLEMLQVRRIVEPAAAALAAIRATDAQLAELAALLQEDGHGCGAGQTEAGAAFHRAVAALAGNATLAALVDGLSSPALGARLGRGQQEEEWTARLCEDHHRIHRALLARDPDAAKAAATLHVLQLEEWLHSRVSDLR
ncbi:FadR family transcriptional regulator [Thermobifida alba]|uniref:FadR family transcriptional regulator n=1 Tax=Thermobifida alba TaxID=53522 RepID=A0ABY4L098_THEAE|nr:FCD domain-containing protein [Thermobifida alba]UPT20755.1 FadR family transcriptional regulator [Thermobifida alba]HLU97173.1 FCD domain-containing protein [Thermobifida alba]